MLGTLGSALAPTYALLLTSRALTAAAQALFWALVVPVGASLVPRRLRGRAVTLLFAGSSLAGVLGVPAGTWLGQQAGWRAAFLGMSAFALGLLVLVAVLLPSEQGAYEGARDRERDRTRAATACCSSRPRSPSPAPTRPSPTSSPSCCR